MTWQDGISDGGSAILSYKIQYDQSIGSFTTLVDGLTTKYFTTSGSLIKGRTYKFKI
jgi:hypothetical protein